MKYEIDSLRLMYDDGLTFGIVHKRDESVIIDWQMDEVELNCIDDVERLCIAIKKSFATLKGEK